MTKKKLNNTKPEVAFFEIEPWEQEYIKKGLKGFKLRFFENIIGKKDLKNLKNISVLSPFIYSKVDKNILESLPALKLVATRSTGFDHIDVAGADKKKVKVCNVPFYGENTVAEHAFALILSLSRNIHLSHERTMKGDFRLDGLQGFDLKDKTIGIIGGGHIGQHVARIARGFEMNILVSDPNRDPKLAKRFGFKYTSLENLLKKSQVITLHAPYNKHTHHLINCKNIKLIQPGTILVNTARGGLIDTTALVEALHDGRLAGLGTDVLEAEKYVFKEERELVSPKFTGKPKEDKEWLKTIVEQHVLINSSQVVVTPHNAFNSKEALQRILDTTIENITKWYTKKKLNNQVIIKK
ncbi:hydroxyacid dehydrogenase [bacterium]|jgi:D-lactate dehydrogenase|nr:hydroxyacid dehydrogenase [bacterium]MBT4649169.1 hydroxyacid dehydrogenase [bacterium]